MKKHSWIVALIIALSFTGLLISCGVDAIPPTPLNVTVDGAPQAVLPAVVKGAVVTLKDSSGYTWSRTADWQGSYAYFQLEKKLKDTGAITFTITGSGGDCNYKNIGVYVEDSVSDFEDIVNKSGTIFGGASGGTDWNAPKSGYGIGTQTKTFRFDNLNADSKKPYVCIYVHAPVGAVYEIKNITIIPKDAP